MTIPVAIAFTEERPVGEVGVKKWNGWQKEGNKIIGEFWHKKILKKHFTQRARKTYGHRPRTSKYLAQKKAHAESGRKWRRTGETVKQSGRVDNVLTGNLRRRLQNPAFTTIKPFPSRVTIKMLSIVYAPQRPRSPKQPDKIGEIFTTTAAERKQLSEMLHAHVMKRLRAYKAPRTTKTK
jgi:hypothetical protein